MNISYPALCHFEDDGYWCEFPDLESCFSQGDTEQEVVANAKEALEGFIESYLEQHISLPKASPITSFHADGKDFLTYITCNIPQGTKSVKKTLTIPAWLNYNAEKAGINFSQTLQEALIQKLNISTS
ncbi:MAG: type II toxin-antitoxin system HicB family antitoxin [Treponema sp.]|jgi:predicted RNase H-like HicB family nuclease|nr:type II toxin-antitoxin system HicB family antitoxin [Treponema sp.]